MPAVSYWCETWSLTLREECRLRVSESRVLRKIFAPKRDEVTVDWKDCIIKSFLICIFIKYYSCIKIDKNQGEGHLAHMRKSRCAYRVLVGKPEGMSPLGRTSVDRKKILRWIFRNWDGAWTGLNWLKIGTGGRLLYIRQ